MAIFKCKMCGGDLDIQEGLTTCECTYCGTQQTIPKFDDERKITLFTRANHLRFNCEFDKAAGVYESIVTEFPEESEGYWGLLLCKYGIEYVDDKGGKKVPTCHRTLPKSIMDDEDFSLACDYANTTSRVVYREEAKAIDLIQKQILKIAATEEPYDIFICYKETDEVTGSRTDDSAIAQDIYTELIKEGYKVFFSRVTLREVAGTEYEPYIYAALSSAKVMLAIGTKFEYYDAIWVKNEWSRFISMIGEDSSKVLIPCFKNMDAYDMPKEFKNMQALDMGDVTFFASLTANINRLLPKQKEGVKETIVTSGNSQVAPLLKRVNIFLEDKDWNSVKEYCEKILDIDPENAQAYLGKLMAELSVSNKASLKNVAEPFNDRNNYQKVMRYGDEALKKELKDCIEFIKNRNENTRLQNAYNGAKNTMNSAKTEDAYKKASDQFKAISEFKDSAALAEECLEKAEEIRVELIKRKKDDVLNRAKHMMTCDCVDDCECAIKLFKSIPGWKDADEQIPVCQKRIEELKEKAEADRKDVILNRAKNLIAGESIHDLETAINILEKIPGWKDADSEVYACQRKIEDIKTKEEAERLERERKAEEERLEKERITEEERKAAEARAKRNKKIAIIGGVIAVIALVFAIVLTTVIIPNGKYNDAIALMEAGKYEEAITAFEALGSHKDSTVQIEACKLAILDIKYEAVLDLVDEGKYQEAIAAFKELDGYKDSSEKINECNTAILETQYKIALELLNKGEKLEAMRLFNELDGHKDSVDQIKSILKDIAIKDTISAGTSNTVGLKSDGTVVATKYIGEYFTDCSDVGGWTDIVSVSAGNSHTVGLKSDGTVVAVGGNPHGQCDVSDWSDIVAISAGDDHTVGLKSDGTVVATDYKGNGYHGECDVSEWTDIVAISAGTQHTVGLKSDGTVVAIGDDDYGCCDVSNWKDIVAISAGTQHTVGIKSDGTVVAVGSNYYGQCNVSEWKDIVAISAGAWHTVGLKSDGTVVAVGHDQYGRRDIDGWTDIVAIDSGEYHTVGLKSNGTVISTEYTGKLYYGQCDVGNLKNIKTPKSK